MPTEAQGGLGQASSGPRFAMGSPGRRRPLFTPSAGKIGRWLNVVNFVLLSSVSLASVSPSSRTLDSLPSRHKPCPRSRFCHCPCSRLVVTPARSRPCLSTTPTLSLLSPFLISPRLCLYAFLSLCSFANSTQAY